jgi:hypothetical protein
MDGAEHKEETAACHAANERPAEPENSLSARISWLFGGDKA